MISGAHIIVHSKDAEADRAFFRDVLGFASVDAGYGWLIFALPPSEAALHPAEVNGRHELYFMCDDLKEEIAALTAKGVVCSAVTEERWGAITMIILPSGSEIGLYEPKHATALNAQSAMVTKKSVANRS
jgi:catechol 2,3-dioxygenase-like lactoylglutathione lyase family enzyme